MITQQEFDFFIGEYLKKKAAQVLNARVTNRDQIYTFEIDLSVAVNAREKKYRIDKPFKSISFEDATNPDSYVLVQFDEQIEGKSYKKFKDNSSLTCETMFNGCTIYFPAQTGTISCTVYYDSEFRSGSLLNSGAVQIQAPAALSQPAQVTANDTGSIFIPANTSARFIVFENKDAANVVYWGGASIGAVGGVNEGISLQPGASERLECSGDIYLRCAAAQTAVVKYVYIY